MSDLFFHRFKNATSSPVAALNYGISVARGDVICAFIDGARMASPGLLYAGLLACRINSRAVVGSISFHLGHEPQNQSVRNGYDQAKEDSMLQTVNWQNNGYQLFRIASLDPSSRFGLYACPAETNSLFMNREFWFECGGFDESFESRGGGLANLDLWRRLCAEEENLIITLIGEGTFHQIHGGAATNAQNNPWDEFHREYVRIRGVRYSTPNRIPFLFGAMNEFVKEFENESKQK